MNTTSFKEPIYVTRPALPDLGEYLQILKKVWKNKWITNNGPMLQLLEKKLQDLLKVPNASIVNNGTTALMLACKALGLKGEVITTPFTCAATIHALIWNGIKPVFCDLDPVTMNMNPEKIESLITNNTSAILPVHLFGYPCDLVRIKKIAKKHGLKLIYDAAHAFGVEVDGVGIGNYGDISTFSMHATKSYHTAEGGCLTSRSKKISLNIALLRNIGIKNQEEIPLPGINAKMSELHAALGLVNLGNYQKERNKRELLVQTYRKILKGVEGISFMENVEHVKHNYSYFAVRINKEMFGKNRDHVKEKLKGYNVFARKYFFPLCSDLEHVRKISGSSCSNLPVAKAAVSEILVLPLYSELSVNDVEKICSILKVIKKE